MGNCNRPAVQRQQYPQHGNQAEVAGLPLARLVGVISLATGAVLTAAMGPARARAEADEWWQEISRIRKGAYESCLSH